MPKRTVTMSKDEVVLPNVSDLTAQSIFSVKDKTVLVTGAFDLVPAYLPPPYFPVTIVMVMIFSFLL